MSEQLKRLALEITGHAYWHEDCKACQLRLKQLEEAYALGRADQREDDAVLCEAEKVSDESAAVVEEDRAYNQACRDCAWVIRQGGDK